MFRSNKPAVLEKQFSFLGNQKREKTMARRMRLRKIFNSLIYLKPIPISHNYLINLKFKQKIQI